MANALNSYRSNLYVNTACDQKPAPLRTITSAVGSFRNVNDRLKEAVSRLSSLSDQIGGPRPCGTDSCPDSISSGVVGELHQIADDAQQNISALDELIASISRQLG